MGSNEINRFVEYTNEKKKKKKYKKRKRKNLNPMVRRYEYFKYFKYDKSISINRPNRRSIYHYILDTSITLIRYFLTGSYV